MKGHGEYRAMFSLLVCKRGHAGVDPGTQRSPAMILLRMVSIAVALIALSGAARVPAAPPRPGSLLLFPEVVNDGRYDTVLRITNSTNSLKYLRCFVTNAAPVDPNEPAGPGNPQLCTATEFTVPLGRQEVILWAASEGFRDLPPRSDSERIIPPLPAGFRGALRCIEYAGGIPIGGNAWFGQAQVVERATGDSRDVAAIAFRGSDSIGAFSATEFVMADGGDYESCPAQWRVDLTPEGGEDPVAGSGSLVQSKFMVIPCAADFETFTSPDLVLQGLVWNEFAALYSFSVRVGCWGSIEASEIDVLAAEVLGGAIARVEFTSIANEQSPEPGFILSGASYYRAGDVGGSLSLTPTAGSRSGYDTIRLPELPLEAISPEVER